MTSFLKIFCLLLILPALAAAGDLQVLYPETGPAPLRESWFGPASVPDCDGATILAIGAGFDSTLIDSTSHRSALVGGYSCNSWNESGPEFVLGLQITDAVYMRAVLASTADLDLFLLSDCRSDSCQAAHGSEFTVLLPARVQPYWLVVDGYLGAAGAFSLRITGTGAGLDPAICAAAIPTDCGDGSTNLIPGDIFDQPDRLNRSTCAPSLSPGGEVWYRLSVQDTVTIDVVLKDLVFDGVLWLFDGCGSDAACLAYANTGLSETSEHLVYRNGSGGTRVYYLGVDAMKPVGIAQGSNIGEGLFSLSLTCEGQIVPVRKTSFGEIKSMFR